MRFAIWIVTLGISLTSIFGLHPVQALEDEKPELDTKELRSMILQAYRSGDPSNLQEVLDTFGTANQREPVRAVLQQARRFGEHEETSDWYWILLQAAASFNRPLALSEVGDYVIQHRTDAIGRDLLHSIQSSKNRSKYVTRVIRRVLEQGTTELRLMAIDLSAQLPYRRTVDILMAHYKTEDEKKKANEVRRRIVTALQTLTLQKMGDNYVNWAGWWKANRKKGLKVIRYLAAHEEGPTGVAMPLDPVRAREFFGLENIPDGKVLVVEGPVARNGTDTNNDDISAVLSRLGVKHDVVLKEKLDDSSYSIDRYQAILINCTQIHKFCQNPDHSAGNAVGNRLRRC